MSTTCNLPANQGPQRNMPDGATVTRMWKDGPLRLTAETALSSKWLKHDSGLFCGPYVCEVCRKPSDGVYAAPSTAERVKAWVCGSCRGVK